MDRWAVDLEALAKAQFILIIIAVCARLLVGLLGLV